MRGNERSPIFREDADREKFLKILARSRYRSVREGWPVVIAEMENKNRAAAA
jgi:hypothetical protein